MIKNLNPSKIPGGTNHISYWFITALFTTVVLIATFLANTAHLTSWKGGGFGMFANQDFRYMRGLTVQAITENDKRININADAAIDYALGDNFELVGIKPSKKMLREIGQELIQYIYIPTDPPEQMRYVTKILIDNKGKDLTEFKKRISYEFYSPIITEDAKTLPYRKINIKEIYLKMWQLKFNPKKDRFEVEVLIPELIVKK